jgi:hypothetical protein
MYILSKPDILTRHFHNDEGTGSSIDDERALINEAAKAAYDIWHGGNATWEGDFEGVRERWRTGVRIAVGPPSRSTRPSRRPLNKDWS